MDNAPVSPGDNGQVSVSKSTDELLNLIFGGSINVHGSTECRDSWEKSDFQLRQDKNTLSTLKCGFIYRW